MKWAAHHNQSGRQLDGTIQYDQYAGYYLYVYINGADCYDYLQDTLQAALDQALEQFGIPKDAWKKVE